jgi:nitroreductase
LLVFEGEAREQFGEIVAKAHAKRDVEATPAKLELEAEKLLRAPLVIAVVSRIRPGKHPAWEQILSAGAVCYNLCLAANALGFGANWLSEWIAYDDHVKEALELGPNDNIAGFIYIGTATETQDDRERPDLSRIVTRWRKGGKINTGDGYGFGAEMPGQGFSLKGFNSCAK